MADATSICERLEAAYYAISSPLLWENADSPHVRVPFGDALRIKHALKEAREALCEKQSR